MSSYLSFSLVHISSFYLTTTICLSYNLSVCKIALTFIQPYMQIMTQDDRSSYFVIFVTFYVFTFSEAHGKLYQFWYDMLLGTDRPKSKSYWLLHVYPYFKYTSSIATIIDWNNEWKWLHRWCILTKKSATLIFVSLKNILSWLVYCHVGEITLHKMSMKDSKGGWNRITRINAYWTPREVNWRQDQFFAFFWQICQLTCQ